MLTALCFLQVKSGLINEVGEALTRVAGVATVYSVTGKIDLVVVITVKDHDEVARIVNEKIGIVPGIVSTETHIAFKTYRPQDIEAGFSIGADS
jgi:DNA-binding Lrp family transcriptional regulator